MNCLCNFSAALKFLKTESMCACMCWMEVEKVTDKVISVSRYSIYSY